MLTHPPVGFVAGPFRPDPLLKNRHAQTIAPIVMPRPWRASGTTRQFVMPDGDRLRGQLSVHPDDPRRERPLLILLHGLEASADIHYIRGLAVKAHAVGFHTLRLNFRNCGDTEHLGARLYNALMADDVAHVLAEMASEGFQHVILVGISFGAGVALNLLAEAGEHPPRELLGAVVISPPIEFGAVSVAFGEGLNWIYDRYFLLSLQRKLARKAEAFPLDAQMVDWARRASQAKNLREFDDTVTAPEAGLVDAEAYYNAVSVAPRLDRIHVPVLILHAQDDPFIPYAMFERHEAALAANPWLTTVFPRHGGHAGFLEGALQPQAEPWMDAYWAENQAIAFARHLEAQLAAAPVPDVGAARLPSA